MTTHLILLAEDEVDVRQFFVRALGLIAPAARVLQAADGREALELFQQHQFDLVISDHRMPYVTGVALLQAVRATTATPFILITADRSVEREALAAGVTELLTKPISIAALRAAVARHLPA
jgi:CheY-like chemotaxis protein